MIQYHIILSLNEINTKEMKIITRYIKYIIGYHDITFTCIISRYRLFTMIFILYDHIGLILVMLRLSEP